MSAYTLGPWKVSKDAVGASVLGKISGEWVTVADQLGPEDARLIAAAPRMLKALSNFVANQHTESKQLRAILYNEARAILRDVEGESHGEA